MRGRLRVLSRLMVSERLRRRFGDERGAVMMLTGIAMTGVLAATALAVDLGKGTDFKRDLQGDADLAALDAVRALGDRKTEVGLPTDALARAIELADESLERNEFDVDADGHARAVTLGYLNGSHTFVAAVDPVTGAYSAVQVRLSAPMDWSFQPGGRDYTATGVAEIPDAVPTCYGDCDNDGDVDEESSAEAGIMLGSWIARLDTSKSAILNSVLGGFLGGAATLDLVSYQGLAAGEVTLRQLGTALGLSVGSPDDVLDTTVTMKGLLNAMASALTAKGDAASLAAATPIATLAATASSTIDLQLAELINVAQGGGAAALDAGINVMSLVSMAAQVADGDHFISIPNASISIPLIASVNIKLQVIEAPQIAIGPAEKDASGAWVTQVTTAQIRAKIDLSLLNGLSILGIVRPVTLPLYIEGGSAHAELRSITCAPLEADQGAGVWVQSQALSARVGTVTDADLMDTATAVSVSAGDIVNVAGLIRITGSSTVNSTSTSGMLNFTGPWPQTQSNGGATTLGLANPLRTNLTLTPQVLALWPLSTIINGLVGGLLSELTTNLLGPVFNILDANLIDGLLSTLGLSLGGADVTVFGHHCQSRRLVN